MNAFWHWIHAKRPLNRMNYLPARLDQIIPSPSHISIKAN